MPPILRRSAPVLERPEARGGEDGDARTIGIYAIVWERESSPIWGMFREIIDRDVALRHPDGRDWMMWHQHDSAQVLGREDNESLSIERGRHRPSHGQRREFRLPDGVLV